MTTWESNAWWEASGTALCMPSGEEMWLSRVRENLTHGCLGGRWRRGGPAAICESQVGVRWKATTMAWSGLSYRSTATAPASYPAWLWRVLAIYPLLKGGFLVPDA